MRRSLFPFRFAFAALLALLVAKPAAAQPIQVPAPAPQPSLTAVSAPIQPIDGFSASGLAVFQVQPDGDGHTLLTLDLQGLVPGEEYVVNLRGGTPEMPSAGFGVLGRVQADADGNARLQTGSLTASAGGATVYLSMDLVADGDHFLEVRAVSEGVIVATGVIPAAGADDGSAADA